ncbi:hypothetical protein BDW69DRAFT_173196 [Aspergillus filifer]
MQNGLSSDRSQLASQNATARSGAEYRRHAVAKDDDHCAVGGVCAAHAVGRGCEGVCSNTYHEDLGGGRQCGSITHMLLYTQTLPLGLGRHMWDVRAIDLLDPSSNRVLSAGGISFPWTLCFAKISILLLYKRIFLLYWEVIASWIGIVADAVMYAFCIGIAIGSIVKCAGLQSGADSYCEESCQASCEECGLC